MYYYDKENDLYFRPLYEGHREYQIIYSPTKGWVRTWRTGSQALIESMNNCEKVEEPHILAELLLLGI